MAELRRSARLWITFLELREIGERSTTDVPYSTPEKDQLQNYVTHGGTLFLYIDAQRPVATVAERFGITFVEEKVRTPFVSSEDLQRVGATPTVPADTEEVPFAITAK